MSFLTKITRLLILLASIFILASCTWATRYICHNPEISTEKTVAIVGAANTFSEWLDQTGAELVVATRRGQNLDQYSFEFSHIGFIRKEENGWFAYHLLNICPSDRGGLFKEGMVNFVAPATQNYRIAVVIPEPDIQKKLALLLDSKTERDSVFDPRYNAAAYAFGTTTQNCGGWVLEFFAKALANKPIPNREEAIQWLQQDSYEPSLIQVGPVKQIFADLFMPQMGSCGHPQSETNNDTFLINSADSALRYIARYSITPSCEKKSETMGEKVCIFQYAP